jgi:hypothetical protein
VGAKWLDEEHAARDYVMLFSRQTADWRECISFSCLCADCADKQPGHSARNHAIFDNTSSWKKFADYIADSAHPDVEMLFDRKWAMLE